MSDPMIAEGGAVSTTGGGAAFDGFARVAEIGPLGMITLRATPDAAGLAEAIGGVTGTGVPAIRQILHNGDRAAAWMSPDEYLLILPYGDTDAAQAVISGAMAGAHHLAVTVSDARAVFRVTGARADEVIAKIAPVDLNALPPGEMRRSRAAQVAAAFWRDGDGFTLVCFRSVARYVFDLLAHSAR